MYDLKNTVTSKPDCYLFGDYGELHNRISKCNNFSHVVQAVKDSFNSDRKTAIGISRYNFMRLPELVQFYKQVLGENDSKKQQLEERFNIFPVKDILSNFVIYIEKVKKSCPGIDIRLFDDELLQILEIVGYNAYSHPYKERDLARLLGIICEEAFIGPQTIVIDPYHKCNIKCAHCFVHNPLIKHKEGFLDRKISIDKFKEIVDDIAESSADEIILQGDGEPLMHPDILAMIRYIRQKGLKALFFTNGTLLNENIAREVVDLQINEIYCSLPAATAPTYERVCNLQAGHKLFNAVVKNMKNLMDVKRREDKFFPRLTMTHVIHKLNCHEILKMAELDAFMGVTAARFYLIRLDGNNNHLKLDDQQIKLIKRDLPLAEQVFKNAGIDFVDNINFQLSHYDSATGAWSKDVFLKNGCHIGWYFCLIPALGDVSMCCHLRTVGDLRENRFSQIWKSRYYKQKRYDAKFISSFKDSQFLNGVSLFDEHCQHCDNHQNLLNIYASLKQYGLLKFLK